MRISSASSISLGAGAAGMAPQSDLPLDGLHDLGVAVTQNACTVSRDVADVLVTIYAPLLGALQSVDIHGEGCEHASVVGDAVGEEAPGPLGEGLRLGVGLDKLLLC